MNDPIKQRQLLNDVLAESATLEFRAALLNKSLRLARRRRQWRHARNLAAVLGLLALGIGWVEHRWRGTPTPQPLAETSILPGCRPVNSRPLPAKDYVDPSQFAAIPVVSSRATVTEVATQAGGFHFINDAQLLALTGSRPAILIRTGPQSEELLFADTLSAPGETDRSGSALDQK